MSITDDDRAEADRLTLLPKKEQWATVELIRSVADNAEVSAVNRREARRRGEAAAASPVEAESGKARIVTQLP